MAIKKICNKSACNQLVNIGQRYCNKHKQQEQMDKTERNRFYDEHKRNKEASAFYHSAEWGTIRGQALIRDHYLCCDCLDDKRLIKADVVDHIKSIEWFPESRLILDNLRSLCHEHHNKKTAEDKKKYGLIN
ncbi:HNH endonuclease [Cohnella sp. WQ 127256]|uniref:HNH endonuclease n=1 Tax=Cohnella sp. WQ 127256 TaxID=2938790 RepID=UPI00211751C1|nr:HNH endonuclease [Cohnella sp. WQ 127256]